MHPGAFKFVGRYATQNAVSVIEIGSRQVLNQAMIRDHFPAASWIGLDRIAGPCVDVVCDAIDYTPKTPVDLVICCEVFEHTPDWRRIIEHAAKWLVPGGRIVITCAGIEREIHSGIDGGHDLHDGEWYRNIGQRELAEALHFATLTNVYVSGNEYWRDTYGTAIR